MERLCLKAVTETGLDHAMLFQHGSAGKRRGNHHCLEVAAVTAHLYLAFGQARLNPLLDILLVHLRTRRRGA